MAKPDAYPDWATTDDVDPVSLQNNVVEPLAAKKLIGWERQEKPPRQWFNWLWRYAGLWVRYLDEQVDAGIPEWDATRTYNIGFFAGVTGTIYQSITNANVNNNPTTDDGTNWLLLKDNQIRISTITPAADADVILDRDEYSSDLLILANGLWTAGHNIIVPNAVRQYWVNNSAGTYDAVVKTAAGTGITVAAGSDRMVVCDGTNVIDPVASGYVLQTQAATTTQQGIIELATQAEVDAGADTERAVTPETLAGYGLAGNFNSVQVFAAGGTWNKPAGLKRVKVTVIGGGSGGSTEPTNVRGGGGGGGAAIKIIEAASLGATETVTVGAGGAAGAAGGTSSFGAHCSATGGAALAATLSDGASGGIGSSGDLNIQGGGGDLSTTGGHCAQGGSSILGGGGKGRVNPASFIGEAGGAYGGGGAGGAAGADGVVIVEEFF